MDAAFGQFIETLEKAQSTMTSQLDRLSRARVPDRVRLPRLKAEARQFRVAGAALLVKLRRMDCNLELDRRIKGFVTFFEEAERRAALLLQKAPEARHEADDEAFPDEGHEEARGPCQAVRTTSGSSVRLDPGSKGLRMRAAPQGAGLELARKPTAKVIDLHSRRALG